MHAAQALMFVLWLDAGAWCGVLGSDKARCGFLHEWNILVIVWLPLTVMRHCTRIFFMLMCRGCLDFCWLCSSFPLKAGGFSGTREIEETPGRMRGTAALPLSCIPVEHQGHHCHQELPDRKPLPVLAGRSLSSITCRDLQWEMSAEQTLY